MNNRPLVQLKKFKRRGLIPMYQSAGAAAFDLHACFGDALPESYAKCIKPGETVKIPTGIGIYLQDPSLGLFIWERSGLGAKGIQRRGGLVDSDYQGELQVIITNGTSEDFYVQEGTRIAQAVIAPVIQVDFDVVDEFSASTARGASGFGSTGIDVDEFTKASQALAKSFMIVGAGA